MGRNDRIRRELGFGQGSLREKLRDYYDPFERRERAPAEAGRSGEGDDLFPLIFLPGAADKGSGAR